MTAQNGLKHHLFSFDGVGPLDISPLVTRYTHELTRFGPYTARFSINAETLTEADLQQFWQTWLMFRLETLVEGVRVWSGFVWDARLDLFRAMRKRSMEEVRNRVKVYKRNPDDGSKLKYTAWFEDLDSQASFGIHERVQKLDGAGDIATDLEGDPVRDSETDALVYDYDWVAQQQIDSYGRPAAAHEVYTGTGERSLEFTAVGRQTIANRILLSDGYISDDPANSSPDGTVLRESGLTDAPYLGLRHGDALTVSQEIYRICCVAQKQGGWLYPLDISLSNEVETAAGVSRAIGVVKRLTQLALVPRQDGQVMELIIRPDGGVVYGPQGEPEFYYFKDAGLTMPNREPVGWRAKAAPIKVMDPVGAMMAGTRVIVPERVSVSADGEARFGPLVRTDADLYEAIRQNAKWIADASER